jgi:mandelate racemase
LLQDIAQMITGDVVVPQSIARKLQRGLDLIGVTGIVRMALSLLDMALWDAVAIAVGLPLVTLLGAAPQPVRAYNSNGLGLMHPTAAAEEALKLLEGGFQAVKLRLGYSTLKEDLERVRVVRKVLADDLKLMVDYNQALSALESIERGRALQAEGVAWLEEPIRHDDLAGCAHVARELELPVQLGENFNGPLALQQALAVQACDLVMPDVARIGGVTGWMQAAGVAAAFGVPISTHLMPEISAHLLAASPGADWLEYVDWLSPLLEQPFQVIDGSVVIPDRPGIGLVWNASAVKKYRYC